MKKLLSLIMALVLALAMGSMLVSCDGASGGTGTAKQETGSLIYELVKDVDEEGNPIKYYKVTKMFISDADAKKVNDGEDVSVNLTIPATYNEIAVKKIASEAFINQKVIKTAVIPSTIEEIGAGAFSGCSNLKEITLPFIGEKEGAVNEKKVLGYIFGTVTGDGLAETKQRHNANTETTTSYYVPTALTKITYTGTQKGLSEYAFNACNNIKEVVLNTNVTTIPRSCFEGCTGLEEYELISSITKIGPNAFKGCEGLLNVIFSQGLTEIGANAFQGCVNLSTQVNIKLPAKLVTLGEGAFKGCTNLKGVDFSAIEKADFVVSMYSFNNCANLKTVVLKAGHTVKSFAFSGCVKLEEAGVENYSAVTKEPNAFSFEYLND